MTNKDKIKARNVANLMTKEIFKAQFYDKIELEYIIYKQLKRLVYEKV